MNGERLRRAREMKGLTQAELADAVGVSQVAIARAEQNLLKPSEELTQQIALKTGFPVSFFHLDAGPDFPLGSLLYRRHATLKSRDRAQAVQIARCTYEIFEYLAQRLRIVPLRLPKLEDEEITTAALLARNALGIEPEIPVRNLIHRLEKTGVVILSLPIEIHEHDGFSVWADHRRPVIALSGGKPGDRQRRTASHELAHLVLHHIWPANQESAERDAEAFSSEFLLPEEAMRREIVPPVTLSRLAELKPRWGVAMQSLVERAYELDIITIDQRRYLWKQLSLNGWRMVEPIAIAPEKPRALRKMAELLYGKKDGSINMRQLARDTCMPITLVTDVLECYASTQANSEQNPRTSVVVRMFPDKDQKQNQQDIELPRKGIK